MPDRNEFGALALGLLVGGLSAAVVTLLYAPQSGKETRTMIRDKAQHTAEETIARAEAVVDEVTRQLRRQPETEVRQPDEAVPV